MSLMGGFDSGIMGRGREDEFDSRSGSDNFEAGLGDGSDVVENKSSKRAKYHRHTAFQTQELEASFKANPHPDEKERLDLGRRLGLEGRQVKFWFQNRRTQMKTQLERYENSMLKQENEKLRLENGAIKDAVRNPICGHCGGPAILGEIPMEQHHLMIENARLKDELNRLGVLATKFLSRNNNGSMSLDSKLDLEVGRNGFDGLGSMEPSFPVAHDFGNRAFNAFSSMMPPSGPSMNMVNTDAAAFDKSLFMEVAMAAMYELIKLAEHDSPLWFRNFEGSMESLNIDDYAKTFAPCIGAKPSHFVTEATRAIGRVVINSTSIVETLMDVDQWTDMFPLNIGRVSILDVISSGVAGNRDGSMQLMQAEFQVLSPMVPVRQMKFIRFCKQQREDTWAVVDVSVDTLLRGNSAVNCRRLPSGCVVQDMSNGYSKVTWIEHTEYDESIIRRPHQALLRSGMAFGAIQWLTNLQRQCELYAVVLPSMASTGDQPALPPSGRNGIVKLAQRMARSFCTGICATVHNWEVVQEAENTKLMMRKSISNSGEPPGIILSATKTIWMPVSSQYLFDFLRDEKTREHWDVLSQDGPMQRVLHIPKDQDSGNSTSLLRASVPVSNASMLILQDTCSDACGSIIAHAAVDAGAINVIMGGGDSSAVAILPCGFAIIPESFTSEVDGDGRADGHPVGGNGSLLTVGFQILVNSQPASKLTMESIETVKSLIERRLQGIRSGLECE